MNPNRWNFFMKKLTRARVVPTISASVSCEIFGTALTGLFCVPYRASSKSPGQPFLTEVEQVVDQVLLDPDVPRQHVRDEPIRQRVLIVQHAHHLILSPREGSCCPSQEASQWASRWRTPTMDQSHGIRF